jgi:hypothetical protein
MRINALFNVVLRSLRAGKKLPLSTLAGGSACSKSAHLSVSFPLFLSTTPHAILPPASPVASVVASGTPYRLGIFA